MRFVLTAAVTIVAMFSISVQQKHETHIADQFPPDVNPRYFPAGVFSDDRDTSDFLARWYACHLRSMSEPSLLKNSEDKTTIAYRFLYLRTFHRPISIRLNIRSTESASLTTIVTNGRGGFRPGPVTENRETEISQTQLRQFSSSLEHAKFWTIPAIDESPGGYDGAEWIFEGIKDGEYHVVRRWSPEQSAYKALCLQLLELSKLSLKPSEIY